MDRLIELTKVMKEAIWESFDTRELLTNIMKKSEKVSFKLSQRSFCSILRISPGAPNHWRKTNRLGDKGLNAMLHFCPMDSETEKRLINIFQLGQSKEDLIRKKFRHELEEQYHLYHKQILEAPKLQNINSIRSLVIKELVSSVPDATTRQIDDYLMMKIKGIEGILKELVLKKVIYQSSDGTYSDQNPNVEFDGNNAISEQVRNYYTDYQINSLNHLIDFLRTYRQDPHNERALGNLVFRIDPSKIAAFREELFGLLDQLQVKYSAKNCAGRIYATYVAGIPMTKELPFSQN